MSTHCCLLWDKETLKAENIKKLIPAEKFKNWLRDQDLMRQYLLFRK